MNAALVPVQPVLRHHAWGSTTVIPQLLGEQPTGVPVAELWIGAAGVAVLVKVLAVADPLSLQLHPDDAAAARGHATRPETFRDPRGKPELLRALTPFTTLSGLRAPDEALDVVERAGLSGRPGLATAIAGLRRGDVRAALRAVLSLDPGCGRRLAGEVADAAAGSAGDAVLPLVGRVAERHPDDPALGATVLLRPHRLLPGQTLWCPAGCPHLHVSGVGVEVQPDSDTTLRAGLTGKPVDVALFLDHLGSRPPRLLDGVPDGDEEVVTAPDGRLRLGVVRSAADLVALTELSLLLCTEGPVDVVAGGAGLRLAAGHGAVLAAGTAARTLAGGEVVRASTLE